jgi:hypothetical protein
MNQSRRNDHSLFVAILIVLTTVGCNPFSGPPVVRTKVTRIDVTYPGMVFKFKRFGPKGSKEHSDGLVVDFKTEGLPEITAIDERLGDLVLSKNVTTSEISNWIKESRPDDSKFVQIKFGSSEYRFENDRLIKLLLPKNEARITKNGKSCVWPCGSADLAKVLGPPTKETEHEDFVGGP